MDHPKRGWGGVGAPPDPGISRRWREATFICGGNPPRGRIRSYASSKAESHARGERLVVLSSQRRRPLLLSFAVESDNRVELRLREAERQRKSSIRERERERERGWPVRSGCALVKGKKRKKGKERNRAVEKKIFGGSVIATVSTSTSHRYRGASSSSIRTAVKSFQALRGYSKAWRVFTEEEQHGGYDGCRGGTEESRDVRYQEILQHRGEWFWIVCLKSSNGSGSFSLPVTKTKEKKRKKNAKERRFVILF